MSEVIIKVNNVSKKFCRNLRTSIFYGFSDISKNMLGFESNSQKLRKEEFWALDNVSFEVKRGEILGIVGPNGAGKSTLLKLLNGIFMPDKGRIEVKGRVGALIEVGAGFHPMLTGRENIYVNGAILGMSKKEIDKKFNSIVEFADIGDFLDSPIKFYSSGMFVRLGFAIAIHCEPDILLIDEILAVGDSAFRVKCYKKMEELKKTMQTTIIFVSHSLYMVSKFCNRAIFLDNGILKKEGDVYDVVGEYQKEIIRKSEKQVSPSVLGPIPHTTKDIEIVSVKYLDEKEEEREEFSCGDKFCVRIEYKINKEVENPIFQISILNKEGLHIAIFGTHIDSVFMGKIFRSGFVDCWIQKLNLLLNSYYVTVGIYDSTHNILYDYWNGGFWGKFFRILPEEISEKMAEWMPLVKLENLWKWKK